MASTAGSCRTTSINHSSRFTGMTFPTVTRTVRFSGTPTERRASCFDVSRSNRPLQERDAFREHQRSREADAGDLRHRPVDSERIEAEQVDLDVAAEAGEDLERLEGEASPLADVGSDEEDAH